MPSAVRNRHYERAKRNRLSVEVQNERVCETDANGYRKEKSRLYEALRPSHRSQHGVHRVVVFVFRSSHDTSQAVLPVADAAVALWSKRRQQSEFLIVGGSPRVERVRHREPVMLREGRYFIDHNMQETVFAA